MALSSAMVMQEKDIERLEEDFLSGRNIRAYIPLCQMLRRERRLGEALEYCQQGLAQGGESLAGRLLFIRLLMDRGRYEEALDEIGKATVTFDETASLLVEKAWCQLKLQQLQEATRTYRELDRRNPFDPRVGLIAEELRAFQARTSRSSSEVPVRWAAQHDLDQIAAAIRDQLAPLGNVHTIAIVDLDSNKTHVEGDPALVEAAEVCYGEAAIACDELGQGQIGYSLIELSEAMVMVLRRERRLLVLAVDPTMNFGKFQHRVSLVLQRYLPSHDTITEQDPDVF